MEGKESLKNFKVGSLPTVFYIPNFITNSEESQLLDKVYNAPTSKWKSLKNRRLQNWGGIVHEKGLLPQELPPWLKQITGRICEESGLFPAAINHVLINEYLPHQGIMPHQDGPAYYPVVAILSLGSPVVMEFTPHSCLASSTSICHSYIEDEIPNAAPSSEASMQSDNHHPFSMVLMPCSLLIFKDDAYSKYLHGISDSTIQQFSGAVNEVEALRHHVSSGSERDVEVSSEDPKCIHRTSTRISLTCRLVPKVQKNLFKF